MFLGYVQHRQFKARVPIDADRPGRRDMTVAPEVKLILTFADVQLGVPGCVGAGVKRTEPKLDAVESLSRDLLFDCDGERALWLLRCRHAEPRGHGLGRRLRRQ